MFYAYIGGYDEIVAFSENEETAKKLAIKAKRKNCKNDLSKWTWETVSEYYGAWTGTIKEGTVVGDSFRHEYK